MNLELKNKWLAALRSGEYRQERTYLYSPVSGGYCCLGVLACVSGVSKAGLVGNTVLNHIGKTSLLSSIHHEALRLQASLITMNDSDRLSFAEIADWIETHVPTDTPEAA